MHGIKALVDMNIEEAKSWLKAGHYPVEFLPTGSDLFYNQAGETPPALTKPGVPGWDRQFQRWANHLIHLGRQHLRIKLSKDGPTHKSPDCYSFSLKNTNYPLTTSMVEAGWKMWHTAIELKSKEECAELGVRFKQYRYAIHCWVSPDGEVVLAKLKLAGKHIPDFADDVETVRADLDLAHKAREAIRAIPSEKMAEMMEDDEEPDIGRFSSEGFGNFVVDQYAHACANYYGMGDDDHAALWDLMQWMTKYGFEEPARLLLQTSDFNKQSAQDIEATIEEWKRDWAKEAAIVPLTSAERLFQSAKWGEILNTPLGEHTPEQLEAMREISEILTDL